MTTASCGRMDLLWVRALCGGCALPLAAAPLFSTDRAPACCVCVCVLLAAANYIHHINPYYRLRRDEQIHQV